MSSKQDVEPRPEEEAHFLLFGSWPRQETGGLGIPVGERVFGVRPAGVVISYATQELDWDRERLGVDAQVRGRGEKGLLVIGGYSRNALHRENGPCLIFGWQLARGPKGRR